MGSLGTYAVGSPHVKNGAARRLTELRRDVIARTHTPARLERLGLAQNTGEGRNHLRGEANAWTLTDLGGRIARGIGAHTERSGSNGASR